MVKTMMKAHGVEVETKMSRNPDGGGMGVRSGTC